MITVKLRDNLRHYDDFDTDFYIRAGETKELSPRLLKSYAFRKALMAGDLIVVSGSVEFVYKDSLFKIDANQPHEGIFLFADKTMATKNLETNTLNSGTLSTEKPKEEVTHAKTVKQRSTK